MLQSHAFIGGIGGQDGGDITQARIPFSVLVKLGQDYLPSRPGTAPGVRLGLAVSAGGLAAPVFGVAAAAHGTPAVFTLLCLLPVPVVAMSLLLPEPVPAPES